MSPFYIFLAILGGVQYFGLKGILYGPLILSFAMIMLFIYGVEYGDELTEYKHPGEKGTAEERRREQLEFPFSADRLLSKLMNTLHNLLGYGLPIVMRPDIFRNS